jgi:hypothetical protein
MCNAVDLLAMVGTSDAPTLRGPVRRLERQVDVAAVGEFEIARADEPAATFDHIARADWETVRKSNWLPTHVMASLVSPTAG